MAVSTSDDATGSYNRYDFDLGSAFGNNFYDYPKLSVWPDAYYMSINIFNASGTAFLGPQPFAMDRTAMLAGNPATIISTGVLTPSDDQLMPADLDGSIQPPAGAPNPFTEIGTNQTWKLWRFHVDFTTPANSTFTLAGTLTPDPFTVACGGTAGACVPQAGVSDQLDTLGDRSMFRNAYRRFADGHEALVGNMTVDSNGVTGIRWWEIDNATSGTPGFAQQSTYQPDNTYRWMGSAAMDAQGDLAVGFSASSSSINPQIRYAGRLAGDPPDTLAQGETTLFAGTGSQTDTQSRWGDYSDMTVDPTDDCTFWYTNEYYQTTSSFNWRTRIGSFKFPNCTAGPSGTLQGTVTDASNSNPIAGATVSTSFGQTTTDGNGDYSLTLPVGTYNPTYSAFGYATDTESNVQISDGQTTTVDVALQPQPSVTVSGTVTDGSGHGWPLYTRIDVAGDPGSPYFTEPVSGHYSIQLPANASYNMTFTSEIPGYQPVEQTVAVGSGDLTHDVQLPITADCTAPGYQINNGTPALDESFEGSFPPSGWTVTDNVGEGHVWQQDDPEGHPNNTGGTGHFADINSDYYGSGNHQDTSLVSPSIDLTNDSSAVLTFQTDYNGFPGQTADVDLSTDGGQTWTTVWEHTSDSVPGPALETVPIPTAGGHSNAEIRFHFISTWGWWWQVDDVKVVSQSCDPIAGGLVEGNVSSLSTGDPINGATVQSNDNPTDKATTYAVPDDPNNPGGYYWLFSSLAGSHPFTASATNYSPDTEAVNVAGDSAVRQDFALGSGHLVITPTSISSTQVLGSTTTQTLTFSNDGTGSADVTLNEAGGSFTILGAQQSQGSQTLSAQGSKLDLIHLKQPASPAALGKSTRDNAPRTNAGAPLDPTWSTVANYPTPIMDQSCALLNGKEYCVGGYNGSANTNQGYVYNPGSNAWTAIANMPVAREKPALASDNGRLYVTGGWDNSGNPVAETDVYDPSSDSWSTVSPNPSPAAAPGHAVVNGKIYFVGGCADSLCTASSNVEVYDPSSDSWSTAANYPTGNSWEFCGGINGKLYCAGGINGSTTYTSGNVYDPGTDSWSPIANLPIDLWGGVSTGANGMLIVSGGVTAGGFTITNQGYAYDPSSDSWAAIPNAQFARYRDGGGCGFYKVGGSSGGFAPTPDSEVLGPGSRPVRLHRRAVAVREPGHVHRTGRRIRHRHRHAVGDDGRRRAAAGRLHRSAAGQRQRPADHRPDRGHDERDAAEVLGQAPGHGHGHGLQREHEPAQGRRLRRRQEGVLVDGEDRQERPVRVLGAAGHLHADRQRERVDPPDEERNDPSRQDGHGRLQPQTDGLLVDHHEEGGARSGSRPLLDYRRSDMKKSLVVALALGFLLLGAAAKATSGSGLRGRVLISPGVPVCHPGEPCTRPAAHVPLRFWRNGRVVGYARTDGQGRFRVALRPRTYRVTSRSGTTLRPAHVTVATGIYRRVTFKLDIGIR